MKGDTPTFEYDGNKIINLEKTSGNYVFNE
jgi:hypothetical protein